MFEPLQVGRIQVANRVVMAEALTFNEGIGIDRKSARLRYLKHRWADRLKATAAQISQSLGHRG